MQSKSLQLAEQPVVQLTNLQPAVQLTSPQPVVQPISLPRLLLLVVRLRLLLLVAQLTSRKTRSVQSKSLQPAALPVVLATSNRTSHQTVPGGRILAGNLDIISDNPIYIERS